MSHEEFLIGHTQRGFEDHPKESREGIPHLWAAHPDHPLLQNGGDPVFIAILGLQAWLCRLVGVWQYSEIYSTPI